MARASPSSIDARPHDLRPGGVLDVLGPTAWRHAGTIYSLDPSHDGALVAGAGLDAWIWSLGDGALARRVVGFTGVVRRVCWSVDDARLAIAHESTVDLVATRGDARISRRVGRVLDVVCDGDGGFLGVSERDGGLAVWRLRPDGRDEPVGVIDGAFGVVALSADGRWLAAAGPVARPGEVSLYEVPSMQRAHTLAGPTEFTFERDGHDFWGEPTTERVTWSSTITALAFDPSGSLLVTGGREPVVRAWDVAQGEPRGALDTGVYDDLSLAFDHAGQRVAVGHGLAAAMRLWNPRTGDLFALPDARERVAVFTRDDAQLVAGGLGHRVARYDARDGSRADDAGDPGDAMASCWESADGRTLLVRTDTRLLSYALRDHAVRWARSLRSPTYKPLAVTSDGATAFTPDVRAPMEPGGSAAFAVRAWRVRGGVAGAYYDPTPTLAWSLDVSPDDAWLAVAGGRHDVDLWRLRERVVGATLASACPHAVAFFADGRGAVVAEKTGTLRVYTWDDAPHGRIDASRVLSPATPASSNAPNDEAHTLVLSPDGRAALSSYNDVLRVWDLASGENTLASPTSTRFARVLAAGFDGAGQPQCLVCEPVRDARGEGCVVRHWTPSRTAEVAWCPSRTRVYSVVARFLRDGARFVMTGDDGVARIHRV